MNFLFCSLSHIYSLLSIVSFSSILRASYYIFGIIIRKLEAKFLGMGLAFSGNWFFFLSSHFLKLFFWSFCWWVLNKGVVLPCLWWALHNACLIEVGCTWVCFLCYFLWLYFAIFRPIFGFTVEKWECMWGSVWMRNMLLVFVFIRVKKIVLYFVLYVCCVVLLSVWVVYFWVLFCSLILLC